MVSNRSTFSIYALEFWSYRPDFLGHEPYKIMKTSSRFHPHSKTSFHSKSTAGIDRKRGGCIGQQNVPLQPYGYPPFAFGTQ